MNLDLVAVACVVTHRNADYFKFDTLGDCRPGRDGDIAARSDGGSKSSAATLPPVTRETVSQRSAGAWPLRSHL
jgi:hypothetical protein